MAAMTIREHFKRVVRWTQFTLAAVPIGALAYVAVGHWQLPISRPTFLAVVLVVLVLVGWAIRDFMYRCPRCKKYMNFIGQTPVRPAATRFWDRYDRCPNCQVNLDEPWTKPSQDGE
jgi:hypothetical protein